MSMTPGYFYKKKRENRINRTSLLFKFLPINCIYPRTWYLSDSCEICDKPSLSMLCLNFLIVSTFLFPCMVMYSHGYGCNEENRRWNHVQARKKNLKKLFRKQMPWVSNGWLFKAYLTTIYTATIQFQFSSFLLLLIFLLIWFNCSWFQMRKLFNIHPSLYFK